MACPNCGKASRSVSELRCSDCARHDKMVGNAKRAETLTGIHPISATGWEKVACVLMDEVEQLYEAANQAHSFLGGIEWWLSGDLALFQRARLQEVYTLLNQAGCGPLGSRELAREAEKATGDE